MYPHPHSYPYTFGETEYDTGKCQPSTKASEPIPISLVLGVGLRVAHIDRLWPFPHAESAITQHIFTDLTAPRGEITVWGMRKLLLILFAGGLLAGCRTLKQKSLDAYHSQLIEIVQAKQAGKISTVQYLKLKQDTENAWLEWQRRQTTATISND